MRADRAHRRGRKQTIAEAWARHRPNRHSGVSFPRAPVDMSDQLRQRQHQQVRVINESSMDSTNANDIDNMDDMDDPQVNNKNNNEIDTGKFSNI